MRQLRLKVNQGQTKRKLKNRFSIAIEKLLGDDGGRSTGMHDGWMALGGSS